jgi:hydroxypyruvate reductase
MLTLLISDVPGDNPMDIASGPTVGDLTTCSQALDIVRRYAIELPSAARTFLESGEGETIKPDDSRLARVTTHLIATPQMALEAAATVAQQAGITPVILSDRIEGEARDVGKVLAALALQIREHHQPFSTPCVLLSGGETTVTVKGSGRGGRNVEFLLSTAIALNGATDIYAVAGDTDGVDGLEEIAGAFIAPDSLERAWARGVRPLQSLDSNDGHGFFEAIGDSLVTGPTLTNVNDFRAILVL